jgi:pimeloyl-ACP methyl ester carboxylesterase
MSPSPFSKPHLVLSHGAWHRPSTWSKLNKVLTQHGYTITITDLPSAGASTPHADSSQDTAAIRAILSQLIETQSLDVILVLHSYSGIPGSNACSGLLQADRLAAGKAGGIVHVIYLASFVRPIGSTLNEALDSTPTWIDFASGFLHVTEENALKHFYNGMPKDEAVGHAKQLRMQSPATFSSPTSFAPWRYGMVKCTYVLAEEDEALPMRASERMFELEGWQGRVARMRGNHCLYIQEAEAVARVIEDVAEKHLGCVHRDTEHVEPI